MAAVGSMIFFSNLSMVLINRKPFGGPPTQVKTQNQRPRTQYQGLRSKRLLPCGLEIGEAFAMWVGNRYFQPTWRKPLRLMYGSFKKANPPNRKVRRTAARVQVIKMNVGQSPSLFSILHIFATIFNGFQCP